MATAGQILIDDALPPEMRGRGKTLDKKGIDELLAEVARTRPGEYRRVSHALATLGQEAAQRTGGFSFGLRHLQKSPAAAQMQQGLNAKLQQILSNDSFTDQQRENAIVKATGALMKPQEDAIYNEAVQNGNPLGMQVKSGARGKKMNLSSLLGSDLLYTDQNDDVIPVPVLHSYSEGLKPWEYYSGTYGARKGTIDVKQATADAGYLSKRLNQVTHRLVITGLDDEKQDKNRGLPAAVDDTENEGSLLARDTGGYKRNTPLTPKILSHLKQQGNERLLVRSPITSSGDGIKARDAGVREHGTLPGAGEYPGLTAAQAIAEAITQSGLSSKHSGGVAGAGRTVSGYEYINSMVEVPKQMKGGATHSDTDGIVARIEDAPAGGKNISVNGIDHYVKPGINPTVKPGDRVEAGDALTEGIPNPAKIVEHKGIGEGRRYFIKAFKDALASAGLKGHRRNIELVARGLINHVRLTDEHGDNEAGDIVPYSDIEHDYESRPDAKETPVALSAGKYLERPVLHHSVGTKLKPKAIKELQDFGIDNVLVHDEPPPFEPEMIRGMASIGHDPDWMTQMLGSGLKGNFLKSVHRGASSDERSTSYVPSLARAVDFGRDPKSPTHKPDRGWKVEGFEPTFEPKTPLKTASFFGGNGVPGSASGPGNVPKAEPAPNLKPQAEASKLGPPKPEAQPAVSQQPAPAVEAPAPAPAQPPLQPPEKPVFDESNDPGIQAADHRGFFNYFTDPFTNNDWKADNDAREKYKQQYAAREAEYEEKMKQYQAASSPQSAAPTPAPITPQPSSAAPPVQPNANQTEIQPKSNENQTQNPQQPASDNSAIQAMLLSQVPNMGVLAPLGLMGGLDFNALGTLTGGPDANKNMPVAPGGPSEQSGSIAGGGGAAVPTSPPVFVGQPATTPIANEPGTSVDGSSGSVELYAPRATDQQAAIGGQVADPQQERTPETLGSIAADTAEGGAREVAQYGALKGIGNLMTLGRRVAGKYAPEAAEWAGEHSPGWLRRVGNFVAPKAYSWLPKVPEAMTDASRLEKVKGIGAGMIAAQTVMDTGKGLWNAARAGSPDASIMDMAKHPVNTIKGIPTGYATTADQLANNRPGDDDANYKGLYLSPFNVFNPHTNMDAITNPLALARGFANHDADHEVAKDIGRSAVNFVAGDYIGNKLTGGIKDTYGNAPGQAQAAQVTANQQLHGGGAGKFNYSVSPNGGRTLRYSDGTFVPANYKDFTNSVPQDRQPMIARDLYRQMPQQFSAIFSDPRWRAMHDSGLPIPPDVQANQDAQMAAVKAKYGLQ